MKRVMTEERERKRNIVREGKRKEGQTQKCTQPSNVECFCLRLDDTTIDITRFIFIPPTVILALLIDQ